MNQESIINLTPNIIQNFIDLKTATNSILNYLDPKLKYKNTYIDNQAIKIENDIHKKNCQSRKNN